MEEDGVQGSSVGGTPLLSGDVEEDGVQDCSVGVLLYGAETWVTSEMLPRSLSPSTISACVASCTSP